MPRPQGGERPGGAVELESYSPDLEHCMDRLLAARRVYVPETGRFQEATTFEVKLPLGLERTV